MDNVINLRKIGNGKILRSGELSKSSDADKADLQNLQVIIDLRMPEEVAKDPEKQLFPQAKYYNLPLISHDKHHALINAHDGSLKGAYELMNDIYVECMSGETATKSFRKIFQIYAEEEGPILFHCSWGKDRTGVTAAITQYVLGYPLDQIYYDYMLSEIYIDEARHKEKTKMKSKGASQHDLDLYHVSCCVVERFLKKGIDAIDNNYGSMDNYLFNALDIDNEMVALLRSKFLH